MAAAIWASSMMISAWTPMATSEPPSSSATARALSRFRSAMTSARAVGGEAGGDRLADARRRPGHQGDPAGVGFRLGHQGQLSASSRAPIDPEFLGFPSIGA